MELIPPTNFDDALVTEFKALGIKETYGKLAIDVMGGGRFASGLPDISKAGLVKHLKKLSQAGIKFNYILNAPCLSGREFTHSGRRKIKNLLNWLVSSGVQKVTVTIPYILQMIKENYPELEVCVSTYAEVDSYQKAKYWQDMGADEITLLDTRVNRDFDLLADIRKRVTLKLRLIANTGCLLHCPFFQYHALLSTHGSQTAYSRKAGFAVDYCAIYCKYLRLLNPVNFIHSQWIRPEDLGIYEKLGIDGIKLIDRRCSTDLLVKITKTYAERKYDGNLLDLLPAFQGKSAKNLGNFLLKLRYFFHPFESDILGIIKLNKVIKKLDVYIDNARLDGFVSTLKDKDCRNKSCPECGYCAQIASAAIRFDQASLDEMLKTYAEAIKVMVKGKYGSY